MTYDRPSRLEIREQQSSRKVECLTVEKMDVVRKEVKEVSGLGQAGAAVPTRRIYFINERICRSGVRCIPGRDDEIVR